MTIADSIAVLCVAYIVMILVFQKKGSQLKTQMINFVRFHEGVPSDYGIDHIKEVVEPGDFPNCFDCGRMDDSTFKLSTSLSEGTPDVPPKTVSNKDRAPQSKSSFPWLTIIIILLVGFAGGLVLFEKSSQS